MRKKTTMEMVHIHDFNRISRAVRLACLPTDQENIELLVQVLMGTHEWSTSLLEEFSLEAAARSRGAERYAILVFDEAPVGGFAVGGIYGALNWIRDVLNPAMPNGWGAALTEPIMWPLVGDEKRTDYTVLRDSFEFMKREDAGDTTAYCVLISPMDRSRTNVIGAYLNDQPDGPALVVASTMR